MKKSSILSLYVLNKRLPLPAAFFILLLIVLGFAGCRPETKEPEYKQGKPPKGYSAPPKAAQENRDSNISERAKTDKEEAQTAVNKARKEASATAAQRPTFTINADVLEVSTQSLPAEKIRHFAYQLSYNEDREQPYYVSYRLTNEMVTGGANGKVKRTDNFRKDPSITTGSAELSDYKGSGYSRGHLVPAGDMTWNSKAMSETFLLSNISPQIQSFNDGIWKDLEEQCRLWAQLYGKVYIITGPVFLQDKVQEIGPNKVDVPDAFFKIIFTEINDQPSYAAYLIPHKKGEAKFTAYSTTIRNIEKYTGLDFLPILPKAKQEAFEKNNYSYEWYMRK